MKIDFKFKGLKKISFDQTMKVISQVWRKVHTAVFFFCLITAIILGGYIWHKSLYGTGWSYEKKQDYISTQDKRIMFKEADFQKVLTDIQLRKDKSNKPYEQIKDIFKSY